MTTTFERDEATTSPGGDPFLTGKFLPPDLPMPLVERPRLLELLTAGAEGPLTSVSAPAGAGKTVLVAEWAASGSAPGPVVWISLESADDEPGAFWPYVVLALGDADLDVSAVGIDEQAEFVDHSFLVRLAAGLASRPTPVVLVLDRAEQLTSAQILDDLEFVLRNASGRLRLVLCTRADPGLALPRRRLERTVTEIRFEDLAFTPDEATELVADRHPGLPTATVQAICRRAGGWAAALCLADVEDQRTGAAGWESVDALAYSDLAAYFRSEVLQGLAASERTVLLATSTVEQVTPALADHLAGVRDAGAILRALAQPHAFFEVAHRDGDEAVVSHPLVRALLQAQLHQESPSKYRRLHRRAGVWLAAAGRTGEAVRSFAAAGAWEDAAAALVDSALVGRLLASGPTGELARLFTHMPIAAPGPCAAVVTAAVALTSGRVDACDAALAQAAVPIEDGESSGRLRLAAALVRCCRAGLSAGDVLSDAESALDAFAAAGLEGSARPETAALIQLGIGSAHLMQGRLPAARRALVAAASTPGVVDWQELHARSLGALALAEALLGGLTAATGSAKEAAATAPMGVRGSADGALALAWVSLARSDLAAARAHADRVTPRDSAVPPVSRAVLALVRSGLRRVDGDDTGALAELDASLPHPYSADVPAWLTARMNAARGLLLLGEGRDEAAGQVLDDAVGNDGLDAQPAALLARGWGRLSTGRSAEAARTSRRLATDAALPLDLRVEALLLLAASAQAASHPSTAVAAVDEALALARPERLQSPFDDAPAKVQALIRERNAVAREPALHERASGLGPRPPRAAPLLPMPPSAEGEDEALVLVEPLTVREQEVLRCLDALMPTEEIARTMYVSVNTVKTHVRAILRKLSAERRYEAVRRARGLGLL